ncbi:MAG: PhnD/SsuA/transferrin family substrate-binding protein [Deltaproteobacteria bacterium]|nr:PhnD/SsuA/transferrin family substrate-binding protein [Deltaproteobacteria bacterium]
MKTKTLVLAALLALSGSAELRAGASFEVLVCYPGGPVKAKSAAPALEKMLGVVERLGGWPAGSFTHRFTSKASECRQLLASDQPAFVISTLGIFLEAQQSNHLVPLANPRIKGRKTERYRIMVKKGGPASLAALKGKKLSGTLLDEPRFLARVIFRGAIDPAAHFELAPTHRALRALRDLARGKLDAVMVNELQYEGIKALPFAGQLEPAFESTPFPLQGLSADTSKTQAGDRQKMLKALGAICTDADGKEMCELFGIDAFAPADEKEYKSVQELWNTGP